MIEQQYKLGTLGDNARASCLFGRRSLYLSMPTGLSDKRPGLKQFLKAMKAEDYTYSGASNYASMESITEVDILTTK